MLNIKKSKNGWKKNIRRSMDSFRVSNELKPPPMAVVVYFQQGYCNLLLMKEAGYWVSF